MSIMLLMKQSANFVWWKFQNLMVMLLIAPESVLQKWGCQNGPTAQFWLERSLWVHNTLNIKTVPCSYQIYLPRNGVFQTMSKSSHSETSSPQSTTRTYISTISIPHSYTCVHIKLQWAISAVNNFSLTSDMWSSPKRVLYIWLTLTLIDIEEVKVRTAPELTHVFSFEDVQ